MEILISMGLGFILDLIFGDPMWLPHPIRLIGNTISKGEKITRKIFKDKEFIAGMVLSIFVVSMSFTLPFLILYLAGKVSTYLKIAIESIFIYQIMATKCLKDESMRVYKYLYKKDILNSRKYLSWIVGRDTENLNEVQITKAAVETVAENASDGVIAPLFYIAIGGAPLGFLYKAVNTLDSMIAYKNDKYLYFGRFAAKMDDVFNFIPAILASYLMIIGSFILGMDYRGAFRIYKRDRHKSSSPNSAKTESVAAGALRIQLLGDAYYFGKLVKKETIGDPLRPVVIDDIKNVNKLMYTAAILGLIIFSAVRYLGVIVL
ncbi:adenosylcobinamide-phosphate synthase [Clostridium sp. DSM 8431]|uniref:adenosylcobinamide-phosphate synthase CbiB n=1 Tax=Clostridium sp. DSM 8431 TaxID=1761781 RepID=UPI0008E00728|nr:adenosylcobinamide-phosphate synthase CbiB [Clostridium sp. DSM 8431]SFU42400.1 adenosylcobinamide-phosphate synthase [Clostridium sp. DSM 8431]